MLILKNLGRRFGEHQILSDISLHFECGKTYVLKGVSGSGKTTLLNILAGLDSEYEGEFFINGKEQQKLSEHEKYNVWERVAYLTQESLLLGRLTIWENLLYFRKRDTDLIEEYMDRYHILHLKNRIRQNSLVGNASGLAL